MNGLPHNVPQLAIGQELQEHREQKQEPYLNSLLIMDVNVETKILKSKNAMKYRHAVSKNNVLIRFS